MNVGIDIGRSSVKLSYYNEFLSFTHAIGEGRDRSTLTHGNPTDNIDITIDGQRYWVGSLAAESFHSITSFEKSHCNENTRILMLAALSLLSEDNFSVVVGLPIADYRTQKKTLASILTGRTKVNDRVINVNAVSVFPQGLGALYSQYLSNNGGLHKEIPKEVGIVDIGFKDFNFAVLRHSEFDEKRSWSFPLGLHTAFMAYLPESNSDMTINDVKPENVPSIYYDRLAAQMVNLINPYWKTKDFPVYSCGGGSYWVKLGEPVENPVFANAIGFRKLCAMKYG